MPSENQVYATTDLPSEGAFEEKVGPHRQPPVATRVFRQRRLLILSLALLGAVIGYIGSKLMTKTYSASTVVEVNQLSDKPLEVNTLTGSPVPFSTSEEMNTVLLTDQAEMQSAGVAFSVIDQLGLAATPPYSKAMEDTEAGSSGQSEQRRREGRERVLALFQSHLKVAMVRDTKLIDVTFTDSDPQRAARVANAIVDTFVKQYTTSRQGASQKASSYLTNQLADLRGQVLESEKRVNDYEQQTGIVGSPAQVNMGVSGAPMPNSDSAIVERFLDLNKALTIATTERIAAEAIYHITANQNPDAVLSLPTGGSRVATPLVSSANSATGAEFAELSALRQAKNRIQLQLASRVDTFGDKSPQIIQLRTELKETDAQIKAELIQVHRQAESEFQLALADERGIRQLVEEQQKAVTRLTVGSNQLALLQQEAASKRSAYQDLSARLEQTNVSGGTNASNITIVDEARPAITPSSPNTPRNTLTGLITGLLLGIFAAFLLEARGSREDDFPVVRGNAATYAALFLAVAASAFLPGVVRAQTFPSVPANIEQAPVVNTRPQTVGVTPLSIPDDLGRAVLAPGFLLELNVFGVPELSTSLRVDTDGNVTVPLLGAIHVGGDTIAQAQSRIAQAFVAGDILKNPQVTLLLSQYAASFISVLGEVQTPGRFPLLGPKNLEEVLALAGGETTAAGSTIEINRQGQPPRFVPYSQDSSPRVLREVTVQSGDSIYIRRAGIVYVLGAVNRPGGYLMVNRGELSVLQAVALASGTTLIAKRGTMFIIRPQPNNTYSQTQISYKDLTRGRGNIATLQANDILYVQTSLVKSILINGSGLISAATTAAIVR